MSRSDSPCGVRRLRSVRDEAVELSDAHEAIDWSRSERSEDAVDDDDDDETECIDDLEFRGWGDAHSVSQMLTVILSSDCSALGGLVHHN